VCLTQTVRLLTEYLRLRRVLDMRNHECSVTLTIKSRRTDIVSQTINISRKSISSLSSMTSVKLTSNTLLDHEKESQSKNLKIVKDSDVKIAALIATKRDT